MRHLYLDDLPCNGDKGERTIELGTVMSAELGRELQIGICNSCGKAGPCRGSCAVPGNDCEKINKTRPTNAGEKPTIHFYEDVHEAFRI